VGCITFFGCISQEVDRKLFPQYAGKLKESHKK
jgi:hypothetical protein